MLQLEIEWDRYKMTTSSKYVSSNVRKMHKVIRPEHAQSYIRVFALR